MSQDTLTKSIHFPVPIGTSESCQFDVGNVDAALGNWLRLPEFIPEL